MSTDYCQRADFTSNLSKAFNFLKYELVYPQEMDEAAGSTPNVCCLKSSFWSERIGFHALRKQAIIFCINCINLKTRVNRWFIIGIKVLTDCPLSTIGNNRCVFKIRVLFAQSCRVFTSINTIIEYKADEVI